MFVNQLEVFEFDGKRYFAHKQSRHFWPCQQCELADKCTAENYGKSHFPECRKEDRKDLTDVAFVEYDGRRLQQHRDLD